MTDPTITDAELARIAAMEKGRGTENVSGLMLFKMIGRLAAEIIRLRKLVS